MTRINTNVESLVARRALDLNNQSLNQALKRLSTGLRINSGKDDPAGLIASETLRSSMRAIDAAVSNANRADTIVSVAEGGLQELSRLLLDMEALVDQTANEAGLTAEEVTANQLQIDSILQSINRLAEATAFGDTKLLNGNYAFTTSGVSVNEATGAAVTHINKVQINAAKIAAGSYRQIVVNRAAASEVAKLSAVLGGTTATSTTVRNGTLGDSTTIEIRGKYGSELLSFASGTAVANIVTAVNDRTNLTGVAASSYAGTTGTGTPSITFYSSDYGADAFVSVKALENAGVTAGDGIGLDDGSQTEVRKAGVDGTFTINGTAAVVKGLDISARAGDLSVDLTLASGFGGVSTGTSSTSFEITGGGAVFSISPIVGLSGQESIGVNEVSTGQIGHLGDGNTNNYLGSLRTGLTNDLSSGNFATAQRIVRMAIDEIASLRGRLGGFQKDTLITTINSLNVARENITAAESAIRDADFASETSDLTRAQILVSSATQTLRIANSQSQNALALLG